MVQGRQNPDSGNFSFKVKGATAGDGESELDHRAEPIDELEIRLAEAELEATRKKREG